MLYDVFDHRQRTTGFRWLTDEEKSKLQAAVIASVRLSAKSLKNQNRGMPAMQPMPKNIRIKEGEPMIECKVFETDDPAYNCGRLLAVLAEIQAKAHDYKLSGPGVAERYFGTASVSPSSVFPRLLQLNRHHIERIRKTSGSTWNQEKNIQQVVCKLAPDCSGATPIPQAS